MTETRWRTKSGVEVKIDKRNQFVEFTIDDRSAFGIFESDFNKLFEPIPAEPRGCGCSAEKVYPICAGYESCHGLSNFKGCAICGHLESCHAKKAEEKPLDCKPGAVRWVEDKDLCPKAPNGVHGWIAIEWHPILMDFTGNNPHLGIKDTGSRRVKEIYCPSCGEKRSVE